MQGCCNILVVDENVFLIRRVNEATQVVYVNKARRKKYLTMLDSRIKGDRWIEKHRYFSIP